MNIIVFIKEVPEMEKVKFDRERGVIDRGSAEAQINPFDLNALQVAVDIKEKAGGHITAISMGPSRAENSLKDSIARGADEGILLTDKAFAGADTWATSFVLSSVARKVSNYDLIICGEMSVDGDTAQVGPQIAEFLGIPHVAFVWDIEIVSDDFLEVKTDLWNGTYVKRIKLPGLLTVTKDINNPQLPSLKNKIKAKNAEIQKMGLKDLSYQGIDEEEVGLSGSLTKVKNIVVPAEKIRDNKIWEGEIDDALEEVVKLMKEKRRI